MERLVVFCLFLMLTAMVTTSYAGVVVTRVDGSTLMIQDGKMKELGGEDESWVVIDPRKEELIMVNDANRTYIPTTIYEFCTSVKAEMERVLQGMSPEERRAVEQMMSGSSGNRGGSAPSVKVKKVGPGGKIAGYKTVRYNVYQNGTLYEELWIAKGTPIEKEIGNLEQVERVSAKFDSCGNEPGMGEKRMDPESSKEYQKLYKEGWVMRRIVHQPGGPIMGGSGTTQREEVRSIQVRKIPVSEFQPPKGYRRISVKDMYKMQ